MKHKIGTVVLFALLILTVIAIKQVGSSDAPAAIGKNDPSAAHNAN